MIKGALHTSEGGYAGSSKLFTTGPVSSPCVSSRDGRSPQKESAEVFWWRIEKLDWVKIHPESVVKKLMDLTLKDKLLNAYWNVCGVEAAINMQGYISHEPYQCPTYYPDRNFWLWLPNFRACWRCCLHGADHLDLLFEGGQSVSFDTSRILRKSRFQSYAAVTAMLARLSFTNPTWIRVHGWPLISASLIHEFFLDWKRMPYPGGSGNHTSRIALRRSRP